jgi:hypothetical protein
VNTPLVDYFMAPDTEQTPARYVLAIEASQSGGDHQAGARKLLEAVEEALRRVAPDYDEERALGTLGSMAVILLKPGAFERDRERRVAAGGSASQIKTPHVIPDPGFVRRQFQHEVLARIEAQGG